MWGMLVVQEKIIQGIGSVEELGLCLRRIIYEQEVMWKKNI
jgi:hypothetical protein